MESASGFRGRLAAAWPTRSACGAPAPGLPVPGVSRRDVWALGEGVADQPTLRRLVAGARAAQGQPWPTLRGSLYARYVRDGDRDAYEQAVFARQRRLTAATVAALATLDDALLDEVADGVVALCEQSAWGWPAHDDTRRPGESLPDPGRPYLDLGAGEVVGQLGWIDHLLGDRLEARCPGVRRRVREEANRRVLAPFTTRRDWHWLGLDGDVHNWNPWIHGNVLVATLTLADPADRPGLLALIVEGLDRYVTALPDDGAIDEGYAYWWNGACRALEALAILRHAHADAPGAEAVPALRRTIAFPHQVHLGAGWFVNVADGQARSDGGEPWHALFAAARGVRDADAAALAVAHRVPGEVSPLSQGLGRLARALVDVDWGVANPGPVPLPRRVWFDSIQLLIARARADRADGLTLVAKGGHNGEHHNHNDVGEVIVALDGVPVLVDVGRPTYTSQTFGPRRYELWPMRSDWHNVPRIRGRDQLAGTEFAAADLRVDEEAGVLRLDLAGAYGRDRSGSWERTAALAAPETVTVTDTWTLPPSADAEASEIHWIVAGEVHPVDEAGVRIVPIAGDRELELRVNHGRILWQDRAVDDPLIVAVWGPWLTRVRVILPDVDVGSCVTTVVARPRTGEEPR